MQQELVLRDVHVPSAPSLWPPAPGWWLLAAAFLLLAGSVWWLRRRRRLRLLAWHALFDQDSARPSSAEQVAAISELMRRAARRVDPGADRLQSEAWLAWLDGQGSKRFSEGPGRLLLEGGFRRDVPQAEVDALRVLARARFVELMERRR